MFKKNRIKAAAKRLLEEELYEEAAQEFSTGNIRKGLWAKAIAKSSGDEGKTYGLYIQLYIQAKTDEHNLTKDASEQLVQSMADAVINEPEPNLDNEPEQSIEKKEELRLAQYSHSILKPLGYRLEKDHPGWKVKHPNKTKLYFKSTAQLAKYAKLYESENT